MKTKCKIGDLGQVVTGKTPSTSKREYYGHEYPFITPSDITGSFHVTPATYLSSEGARLLNKIMIPAKSVCYTCIASIGKICVTKEDSFTNQQINSIIVDEEKNDFRYVYYLLKFYTNHIKAIATGAATPIVNKERFSNVEVSVHKLDKQKRIADILSAYDDLIENNQKQIKLLEEAAMRLYKEWFVKLRFPGHENTKIVDGVPERWRQGQLREYIKVNPRSISKNYPYQEIQYIDIGSVNHGRIEKITTYRLSDAPGRAKRLACDGDTIWGMVRPNLKAYALVLSPGENYVFSTGFAILSPKNIPYTFLYCLVTQDSFVGYLINCTNGSAYPAVKPIHFEEAKVIIPDEGLLVKFHDIVNPMYRRIKVIENQNLYLEEARDRLLPKLMSGEIEV